jgi:hypothetical protein
MGRKAKAKLAAAAGAAAAANSTQAGKAAMSNVRMCLPLCLAWLHRHLLMWRR